MAIVIVKGATTSGPWKKENYLLNKSKIKLKVEEQIVSKLEQSFHQSIQKYD